MTTQTQTIKGIKEKTRKYFEANLLDGDSISDCGDTTLSVKMTWEFLDSIIDSAIFQAVKEREESLIKEIEKIKESVREQNGTFKYDSCYDDVINLIKQVK